MKIAIVGMGYVGLPLAVAFAEEGNDVIGLDVSPARIETLRDGISPVEDVPDAKLAEISARLEPTTDYGAVAQADAIIIAVPTPLTNHREPDLSHVLDATQSIAKNLREGQVVILESTTYPGTTREQLLPLLEESGMKAGRDFGLAFSPERIDPGRTDYTVRTTPKVVGGLTNACTERAAEIYRLICDEVVEVSTPEAAELTKLHENIFRSVNIAMVNEMAQLCDRMGIDIWEVVDAASTKPFGFMRFEPGPGMGGHCLPIDPFYLTFKAHEHDFYTEFIELAGKLNQSQPLFCARMVQENLNEVEKPVKGSSILILGVSYKAGVADMRESPSLKIIEILRRKGAVVSYHDPHVDELPALGLRSVDLEQGLDEADCVCIVTAHPEVDHVAVADRAELIVDFRGIIRKLDDGADDRPGLASFGQRARPSS